MSEIKLKPCPFCGGKAILAEINGTDDYYVVCEVCCTYTDFYRKEKAIKAWNSRVEVEKDREIERLKHKLNNIKDTLTKYHDVSLSKINAKEAEGVHFFVFKFSSALLEIINDNK